MYGSARITVLQVAGTEGLVGYPEYSRHRWSVQAGGGGMRLPGAWSGSGVMSAPYTPLSSDTRISRLQLAFELVQKAPIGTFGDDLLRGGSKEAQFVQPKCIKPNRILGVVYPPSVVRYLAQGLQRIVVAVGEAAFDHLLRHAGRVTGTEVGGLENGAQHSLGCYRVRLHEFAISAQH